MSRMKIFGLGVLAVMLLLNTVTAQPPDTLWTKTYGGSGDDRGYSVAETSDGGFIITGLTSSFGAGDRDVYLIKTDANGNILWTRFFGGSANDEGYSVAQTGDGGYIVTGFTYSYGPGTPDSANVYLIKTDSTGKTIWTKTFGGIGEDIGYSVRQISDGSYIVAGTTNSFGSGSVDIYLIKTDANGNATKTKTIGGSARDVANAIVQTGDGNYIVAGRTESYGTGGFDVYLIRLDAEGTTLWIKTFGGSDDDYGESVVETGTGGCIVAGWTKSYGAGGSDVYLVKTNANGDTLWTKTYGDSENDWGHSVVKTRDGGFIIAGGTVFGADWTDIYLIKTDANGDTLWTKTCGGSSGDDSYSVAQTSDGGYIIVGYWGFGSTWGDVYLIRLGPETGVEENSNLTAESPYLQLGQNPFSRTTSISYKIPERNEVSLIVYDATGKESKRLVHSVQESGNYHLQLDMTGFPQGVYFIVLTAGKGRSVKKVTVLQ